jgi:uncharacterized protein (TIGR00369 family)
MNALSSISSVITDEHHHKLQRMYAGAPISQLYGATVRIGDAYADVRFALAPTFDHRAHGTQGSVYYRALDDAAFFAASACEVRRLLTTVSFQINFLQPVAQGQLFANGIVVHQNGELLFAQAELLDGEGRLIATGSGTYTRSAIALGPEVGYA